MWTINFIAVGLVMMEEKSFLVIELSEGHWPGMTVEWGEGLGIA